MMSEIKFSSVCPGWCQSVSEACLRRQQATEWQTEQLVTTSTATTLNNTKQDSNLEYVQRRD